MGVDPVARRLWPRIAPEDREAVGELAAALRAAHPDESERMLVGRLAARAPLAARGVHGDAIAPSVLRAERRLDAHRALAERSPPEVLDGIPVRWARAPMSRDDVIGIWRRWLDARRAERLFVYAHVPFCRTKCGFCQFESVVGASAGAVTRNLDATVREIDALRDALGALSVDAITVGGGTPSELSTAQLDRLLGALGGLVRREDDTYFSVELNPDSTSEGKLRALAAHGVNRVSFGVQSMSSATLKAIARGYQTEAMVEEAVAAARGVGGLKIAADLIASLPEETRESFTRGAARLVALEPDQIVLYAYQPVSRRGRTMDAGPLGLAEASETFLEIAQAAGYARVPHTGSSVIVERPDARRFRVRYVQHARTPTSLLGVGPFAESHAFGVASYVAGPDLAAERPYRGLARDVEEELAVFLGRRLAGGMPIEDAELVRYFGGDLASLAPEALGRLLEEGALSATGTGYRAAGDRAQAIRAAWAFLDPRSIVRLRRRARGGVPADRALSRIRDPRVATRAAAVLELAQAVSAIARGGTGEGDVEGLRIELPVEELDPSTVTRWFGGLAPTDALARLAAHRLLEAAHLTVYPEDTILEATLAAPAGAALRSMAPKVELPEGWWERAVEMVVDARGLRLRWAVDRENSRLWRAAREAVPSELRDALASAQIRFERRLTGGDALRFGSLEDGETLRRALGSLDPSLARLPGRLTTLRVPLRGARPLLEAVTLERTLETRRALPTTPA